MKIALLTDGISPYVLGGMQTHSSIIANLFVRSKNEVDLFHFVTKNKVIPKDDDVNNLFFSKTKFKFSNIYCIEFPSTIKFPGHYLFNSYKYSKYIFNILRNNLDDYDFIYAKGFSAWKLLSNLTQFDNSPKIGINFHGYEMYQYAPSFKTKFQHYMLRPFVKKNIKKADIVFSYGGGISQIIENLGVSKKKIIEIPALIDRSWISYNLDEKPHKAKILFVGRNERRKGIQELNSSIKSLDKKYNHFEFHFMGNIPKDYQIRTEKIKIVYHGVIVDDLQKQKVYDNCDVLVCPSFSEGMPNVILEAMSRGLAIIATDIGAISEMVNDKNGVLMADNSPENISKSVVDITANMEFLFKLKQNSIKKIDKQFSSEIVFEKLLKSIKIAIS